MQQKQRNWYPFSYIPMFQKQITELLNHSNEQYSLFLKAKGNPSAIDDLTLDRALALFEEQPEILQLYQDQLDRWSEEDEKGIYAAPLTKLNADLEAARVLNDEIIELLEELDTIEDLPKSMFNQKTNNSRRSTICNRHVQNMLTRKPGSRY